MKRKRIINLAFYVLIAVVAYLSLFSESGKHQIPSGVTGDTRLSYEWAKTEEGDALLELLPCYCGCISEGHKHARDCFWRDNEKFEKHGIGCSICVHIAMKAKQMHELGRDICEIRKEIDRFYEFVKEKGTETPIPEGCG